MTTIDEVLARLEAVLADAQANGKRTGFFAALYYQMTAAVKKGIEDGLFVDGPRMERLDVLFASRYLDALEAWEAGRPCTAAWKVAFESTRRGSLLILQQLLLGINAHINLDLGIAAVEVMKGRACNSVSGMRGMGRGVLRWRWRRLPGMRIRIVSLHETRILRPWPRRWYRFRG